MFRPKCWAQCSGEEARRKHFGGETAGAAPWPLCTPEISKGYANCAGGASPPLGEHTWSLHKKMRGTSDGEVWTKVELTLRAFLT